MVSSAQELSCVGTRRALGRGVRWGAARARSVAWTEHGKVWEREVIAQLGSLHQLDKLRWCDGVIVIRIEIVQQKGDTATVLRESRCLNLEHSTTSRQLVEVEFAVVVFVHGIKERLEKCFVERVVNVGGDRGCKACEQSQTNEGHGSQLVE